MASPFSFALRWFSGLCRCLFWCLWAEGRAVVRWSATPAEPLEGGGLNFEYGVSVFNYCRCGGLLGAIPAFALESGETAENPDWNSGQI